MKSNKIGKFSWFVMLINLYLGTLTSAVSIFLSSEDRLLFLFSFILFGTVSIYATIITNEIYN